MKAKFLKCFWPLCRVAALAGWYDVLDAMMATGLARNHVIGGEGDLELELQTTLEASSISLRPDVGLLGPWSGRLRHALWRCSASCRGDAGIEEVSKSRQQRCRIVRTGC